MIHSILAPSASNKWGSENGCTAYPNMYQLYGTKNPETIEAKEGTAAHECGYECIVMLLKLITPTFKHFEGRQADNDINFTIEMFASAMVYACDFMEIAHKTRVFGGDLMGLEKRVDATDIHKDCYGFVDGWIFNSRTNHIYIWDFKHGQRYVDPYNNSQLLIYLNALVTLYKIIDDTKTIVHLRIVQPRSYHKDGPIQEWVINLSELRANFNIIRGKAEEAMSDHAQLRTGPHCRDCCALNNCEAAIGAGLSLYETAMLTSSVDLTPLQMSLQYSLVKRAIQQLEFQEVSLSTEMENHIEKGNVIPGYTMEPGRGKTIWTKSTAFIIALGDSLGIDLRKEVKPITVTQAKALGVDDSSIDMFSNKIVGTKKLKLTNQSKLERVFK